MLSVRVASSFALAAVVTLAGCKSERASVAADHAAPSTVTITARDYAFQAPASIPAGMTTVRLVNQGKELHQAQLIKFEDGKTLDDLARAMKNPGPPPSWIKFVGGPNGIVPGGEASATAVLTPGQYAYICLIPSGDGVIHLAKGMALPFEVAAASSGSPAELAAADVTINLVDYDFEASQPLTPGRHTIRVVNTAPQPHELVLLKLAPGKKVEDFGRWAETGMKGAPPAQPVGGVAMLDTGGEGTFEADLAPGEYGFICFVADAKDGKPHLAHGMMKTIKVG
jgi:plastocyanin